MRIGTERMSRMFPKWFWLEHLVRYNFASKFVKDKIVVDCACGSGLGSEAFLKEGAAQLFGFDSSEIAVGHAQKRCVGWKNASFAVAYATNIPLDDNFAETFISLETIEHIKNDRGFLKEVSRILKSEGVFVCSTPNRKISNPFSKLEDAPCNKFHVREYSNIELESLLRENFNQVTFYGLNRISKKKSRFFKKIRKTFHINGYLWSNMTKAHKMFWDNISNYDIEAINEKFEYEYLVAVCKK